jgi:5'-deoxynucleotidase YfbR-like HD superfamily hydrolase
MDSMYNWFPNNKVLSQTTSVYKQVLYRWTGGQVRRFHNLPTVGVVTVGHHSGTVAWLCVLLTDFTDSPFLPQTVLVLVLAALFHDLPECITGDTPAPAKWASPELHRALDTLEEQVLTETETRPELTFGQLRMLKLADAFAGQLEATQERALGNRFMCRAYEKWRAYITENFTLNTHEKEVRATVEELWRQANED